MRSMLPNTEPLSLRRLDRAGPPVVGIPRPWRMPRKRATESAAIPAVRRASGLLSRSVGLSRDCRPSWYETL